MHIKETKATKAGKLTIVTFFQSLYLTLTSFLSNDLMSYASACSFGFLFSFIPIIMLTLVILVRFLHISPELITSFINSVINIDISRYFNVDSFVNSLTSIHTVTNFEIILGFSIIWMARRFFSSIFTGLRKIFRSEQKNQPIIMQLLIIAGELIIIILIAFFVFATTAAQALIKIDFLNQFISRYPLIERIIRNFAHNTFSFVLLFFISMLALRIGSRTKPSLFLTAIMSAGSTFVFWLFRKFMHLFININKYNIIYGVLSNTIVLLMEIFIFFIIFLFFAQWLYTAQFFDSLLTCELYLLPSQENEKFFSNLKRMLFIRPDFFLRKDTNVIQAKKGNCIYSAGDTGRDVYYIFKGTVQIQQQNHALLLERGKLFGVENCMLDEDRPENAFAFTDVEIIRIPQEVFKNLVERNPRASKKALSQLSTYFARFQ